MVTFLFLGKLKFLTFFIAVTTANIDGWNKNITVRCQSSFSLRTSPVLSLIHSLSLPDVLCDPTDLIWRKGTQFEAMTGRTAPSSDGLLH